VMITRPERSYQLCCVVAFDLETTLLRGHGPCWAAARKKKTMDNIASVFVLFREIQLFSTNYHFSVAPKPYVSTNVQTPFFHANVCITTYLSTKYSACVFNILRKQ
jgi:hypothetical protein